MYRERLEAFNRARLACISCNTTCCRDCRTQSVQRSTGKGRGKEEDRARERVGGRDRKRITRGGNERGGWNEPSASSGSVREGRLEKEKARCGEKRWGNACYVLTTAAAADAAADAAAAAAADADAFIK